jgi:hypothetical protein
VPSKLCRKQVLNLYFSKSNDWHGRWPWNIRAQVYAKTQVSRLINYNYSPTRILRE